RQMILMSSLSAPGSFCLAMTDPSPRYVTRSDGGGEQESRDPRQRAHQFVGPPVRRGFAVAQGELIQLLPRLGRVLRVQARLTEPAALQPDTAGDGFEREVKQAVRAEFGRHRVLFLDRGAGSMQEARGEEFA